MWQGKQDRKPSDKLKVSFREVAKSAESVFIEVSYIAEVMFLH